MGSGGGGGGGKGREGIQVNRRWKDYGSWERKRREVRVPKRGQKERNLKKKNAFKYFAIEKAREKGVGAGKALRVQEAH